MGPGSIGYSAYLLRASLQPWAFHSGRVPVPAVSDTIWHFSDFRMSRGEDFFGCSQDVFHRNVLDETPFCSAEEWQGPVACLAQVGCCKNAKNPVIFSLKVNSEMLMVLLMLSSRTVGHLRFFARCNSQIQVRVPSSRKMGGKQLKR